MSRSTKHPFGLSDRQARIMDLMLRFGAVQKRVAPEAGITTCTLRWHLKMIYLRIAAGMPGHHVNATVACTEWQQARLADGDWKSNAMLANSLRSMARSAHPGRPGMFAIDLGAEALLTLHDAADRLDPGA